MIHSLVKIVGSTQTTEAEGRLGKADSQSGSIPND